jgi:hypothetical protein
MQLIAKATTEELREIRNQLYDGAYAEIADATGYSLSTVQEVFKGRRNNRQIVDAAKELIQLHRDNISLITVKFHRSLKKSQA